jgi:O-antigen/teichoic acid export membrane protein
MALNLRRNAAWAFLGEAVFAACHWGGFIILGRLAGPEELGRYALALAVVLPVMLFGGLQMRQLQVADAAQRRSFQDYFSVRLAGTLAAGLVILCIALLGYGGSMVAPILLVGLAKAFENVSDVHYGLAQRHQRLDLVAQSRMLRGVGGLMALGTGYYLSADLGIALLAMAGVWGLVWWLFDRAVTRRWRKPAESGRAWRADLKRRSGLAWTAAPLGVALMLVTLNANVPRYFIEAIVGLGALGVFTATAQFVIAGRMLINALCQAAFPRLADLYAAGDLAGFRRLLVRLMAASALPGLLGLAVVIGFGRELLSLVYGPQFAEGGQVFVWIMVVGVVIYAQTPLGYGLTAMHQFKIQPLIFGVAVVVNAAACFALVPPYGLLGATLAWLGAAVCQFGLALAVHWRSLQRPSAAARAAAARPGHS